MSFDLIDDAFHYVSNAPIGERSAVVHRSSGKVYLASRKADFDERPAGTAGDSDYVPIPHRQDIDPGKPLLMEFVRSHCPGEQARVEGLFSRSGGFRNAKDHLRRLGLLESWQVFESQRIEFLLRQWCTAQGLVL